MTATAFLEALALPSDTRVEQRVPKKLLVEQGDFSATDKRHIQDGIEELFWVAALKPTNIGVPAFRDNIREYVEISVLTLNLREGAKSSRLIELVHRAIPYPVLLIVEQDGAISISAAHKRCSQGEAGKMVLDDSVVTVAWQEQKAAVYTRQFLDALAVKNQPKLSLFALYQGWVETLYALQAAHITGSFMMVGSAQHSDARRNALREYNRLSLEMARLRGAVRNETQMARQVEANLEIKRIEEELQKQVALL